MDTTTLGHVSLEPKMAIPGVRIVIDSILSSLLAWNVLHTLFRHDHISWLLAGRFGRSSDPSLSTCDADQDATHRFGPIAIL